MTGKFPRIKKIKNFVKKRIKNSFSINYISSLRGLSSTFLVSWFNKQRRMLTSVSGALVKQLKEIIFY